MNTAYANTTQKVVEPTGARKIGYPIIDKKNYSTSYSYTYMRIKGYPWLEVIIRELEDQGSTRPPQ